MRRLVTRVFHAWHTRRRDRGFIRLVEEMADNTAEDFEIGWPVRFILDGRLEYGYVVEVRAHGVVVRSDDRAPVELPFNQVDDL